MVDFSTQTLNARRSWKDIFQALEENNCQPRLLYTAKLFFPVERKRKTFHNKQNVKEFMTIKAALQKILKGFLHKDEIRVSQENARKNKPLFCGCGV
jgi:hypothetical protein